MPTTRTLSLNIQNQNIDLGGIDDDIGFRINYLLETPENFASKQGADPQNLNIPASKNNDHIFNTFHNPQVEDLAPTSLSFRELMPCVFNINGTVPVLLGYAILTDATSTDKPESYDISVYGDNGAWVLALQNFTMWDCVNPNDHVFNVATIESTWTNYNTAGDGSDDFVYAPVRYRQPFDGTTLGYGGDDCVNIYHLRPAISLYWLIVRAFTQIGFTIKSQFFNTHYVKDLVLPWTWGDFYDINSQLVQGVAFKVAGELPNNTELPPLNGCSPFSPYPSVRMWSGTRSGFTQGSAGGSSFWNNVRGGWNPAGYNPLTGIVASIGNGIDYVTTIASSDIQTAGLGYTPGDTFNVDNISGSNATGTILTVGAGGTVTSYVIGFPGDTSSEGYAAGNICTITNVIGVGTGFTILITINTLFYPKGGVSATSNYVFNGNGSTAGGNDWFRMDISSPPDGYDNFLLYSFDPSTGHMNYTFSPPPSLSGGISNVSITFVLDLYCHLDVSSGQGLFGLEILHKKPASSRFILTCNSIMPSGGSSVSSLYPDGTEYPTTPTVYNFTIPNCDPTDSFTFRIVCLYGGALGTFGVYSVFSGLYLNNNPAVLGVSSYAYNPATEQFGFITPNTVWSPIQSSLTMTGFLVQLGNVVNLKNYDIFRNYLILDLLGGVIDMFNLEIQTDGINKEVTIEPMFGSTLLDGAVLDGYFSTTKILDYTNKRDISSGKGSKMSLFSSANRQIDLTFKLDSNDGGQTIWSARNKNIYLNNRTYTGGINQNNINIDNGIMAAIPGAARYMLPNRFAKGNMQMANRFFSATMHCSFPQWITVTGSIKPAPQLITIFPQDATSANAYAQSFAPKLAFYGGLRDPAVYGGWRWIGDPAAPYSGGVSVSFPMPFMAAVNYIDSANIDPILSYCDENINGVTPSPGLLSQFYRQRFAIMRNGQLLTTYLRLNLNDICNWEHQECIMINGCIYALIQIDGYNPLTDDSTPCTLWKVVNAEQIDVDNSFPSASSVLSTSILTSLGQFDLRYAQLMLYPTDIPQVG